MMNVDDILKLVNAGFTKAEIMQLGVAPAVAPACDPAPAGDPAPAQAPAQAPAPVVKEPEVKAPEKIGKTDIEQASAFDKVLQGITGQLQALTSAVQANNIRGANAPANAPETTEDIIKSMFNSK